MWLVSDMIQVRSRVESLLEEITEDLEVRFVWCRAVSRQRVKLISTPELADFKEGFYLPLQATSEVTSLDGRWLGDRPGKEKMEVHIGSAKLPRTTQMAGFCRCQDHMTFRAGRMYPD